MSEADLVSLYEGTYAREDIIRLIPASGRVLAVGGAGGEPGAKRKADGVGQEGGGVRMPDRGDVRGGGGEAVRAVPEFRLLGAGAPHLDSRERCQEIWAGARDPAGDGSEPGDHARRRTAAECLCAHGRTLLIVS